MRRCGVLKRSATLASCAALVVCVACGGKNDTAVGTAQDSGERTTADGTTREANGPRNAAVTLEGCLQQDSGTFSRGYLLTMVNEPSMVGTAGSVTASGSAVEREQMQMAATTYRIDPQGDLELKNMLGKRVRVSGTLTEQAQVPNGNGAIGSDRDQQRPNRAAQPRDRNPEIKTGDLAKVEATSAAIVGEACGGNAGHETSGKTNGVPNTDREPRSRR